MTTNPTAVQYMQFGEAVSGIMDAWTADESPFRNDNAVAVIQEAARVYGIDFGMERHF